MTEWTITTLKEHLEKIIADRDTALQAAFSSSQEAINKAESRLQEILEGFPQEYVRTEEFDSLIKEINAIKVDHVQRREFDALKDEHSQGRGARVALIAATGVIITLITVALGAMYANQLTHKDVSEQIKIESPWAQDKPGVEEDIHRLEQQIILLKTQFAAHEATDRIRASKK